MDASKVILDTLSSVESTDADMLEAKKLIDFMRKTGFPGITELESEYQKVKVQRERFIAEAKNFK